MGGSKLKREAVVRLATGWPGSMGTRDKPKVKRRMDIEAVLRWAYRDELPKTPRDLPLPSGAPCAWDPMARFAEELSLAGLDDNRFGLVPDPFAQDDPHPDAVAIHYAVRDLEEFDIDMPAGWPFLAGEGRAIGRCQALVSGLVFRRDADNRLRLRFSVPMLIAHHAIMGDAPDWRVEDYRETIEAWENGKPKYFVRRRQWFDGPNGPVEEEYETPVRVGHRVGAILPADAYTKPVLDPDPTDDLVSRAKYEVWRAAMDVLAIELEDALETIEVTPCARSFEPWAEGEAPRGRVLPDLSRGRYPWLRFVPRGCEKKTSRTA